MDAYTQARQERIAEDLVCFIDYASRVLAGVERGDWFYVNDKIDDARRALDALQRRVSHDDPDQRGNLDQIRGETVWAKVRQGARNYWLGRLIFNTDKANS